MSYLIMCRKGLYVYLYMGIVGILVFMEIELGRCEVVLRIELWV